MFEVKIDDEIEKFFVTTGHEFEATLDIIRRKQEMSKEQQRKWEEFQGECQNIFSDGRATALHGIAKKARLALFIFHWCYLGR